MKKVSVVIPTLQKKPNLLINLLATLNQDESVSEIIVIDNSKQGINFDSHKLRIMTPEENIFVNPAWNLGVKEAKNDIIALINDDITIPENFCKDIVEKLTPDMGIVGYNGDYVEITNEDNFTVNKSDLWFEKINARPDQWGVAMFCYKTSYFEIPDDLKVLYGDDYLLFKNKNAGRQNYYICGQKIYHYSSLSVKTLSNKIFKEDRKVYKKHTYKWWQYLFNLEKLWCGYRIRLFGIQSKLIKYKRETK